MLRCPQVRGTLDAAGDPAGPCIVSGEGHVEPIANISKSVHFRKKR
ncbi:MAG: hypothetical protein OES28_06080 [Desulfobulbaceae bacterium]|nr:hypothetical protein [Desulfobulbaceae bacterium]HKJ14977.1 hypothetical protein [Desulfobulbales bacterium]MDH3541825.1 hypothetical protein [Desulfobulbaceae bacterium]MDH3776637.1 hypothetical protein [Desulfobulbaceae bacterium]MDH3782956.1 hypothetical protein [Desulfobulbaceae bacterium]